MSIYEIEVATKQGQLETLAKYEGKVLLIVNTASKCGLTPQFSELQELYQKHQTSGLEILGFPCDQFNNQEFASIDETVNFCSLNYGVTFPIYAKIDVNGPSEHRLFNYLKSQSGSLFSKRIKWNFTKFLVDANGTVIKRYAPTTTPKAIEQDIIKLLNK
ncbi:MAG: glutathione peroxidase [Mycoplasmatales bacterium]